MKYRFYHPPPLPDSADFDLPDDVHHHAVTVLRLKVATEFEVFDGQGQVLRARLSAMSKKSAQAEVIQAKHTDIRNESPLSITLVQCLSAAEKMDWTVEKAVELGVRHIHPVSSSRSQIKLAGERADKKQQHWQRIIHAACAQSQRNRAPTLHPLSPLNAYLSTQHKATAASDAPLKLILHPMERGMPRISELCAHPPTSVILLIGPESGFDEAEVDAAIAHGFHAVTLGPRILRTESAGLCAIATVQTLWGDFG